MGLNLDDLSSRVESDPWDSDAWYTLCSEAFRRDDLPFKLVDKHFQNALDKFPSSPQIWCLRLDSAVRASVSSLATNQVNENGSTSDASSTPDDDRVTQDTVLAMFKQATEASPTAVEVWRKYAAWAISHPEAADPVSIYEASIKAAGLEMTSTVLWNDYLSFLKQANWTESRRRDALRRFYKRAVWNPMQDVDQFWQQYKHFEETSNSNKELGRSLLNEAQPGYANARAEFRARRTRREGLTLQAFSIPPRGRAKEASQAAQWRRFIAAERGNPHELEPGLLHTRVVHAFETALIPLLYYPDIWMEYLSYMSDVCAGRNPSSPQTDTTARNARPGGGAQGGGGGGGGGGGSNQTAAGSAAGNTGAKPSVSTQDLETLTARALTALPACVALHHHVSFLWMRAGKSAKAMSTLETLVKSHPSPLAYVHLLRLTRRVSGKDAARKVFARARRHPNGAHPAVYIAAAQTEFLVNKDNKIARNVFEFGLKQNPTSALMVREFTQWLWGLGDFDHLRIVLKRSMPTVQGPPELVQALWESWIELEEIAGDMTAVEAVEKLWSEGDVSKPRNVVAEAIRRSRFLDLDSLREEELATMSVPYAGGRRAYGALVGAGSVSGGGSLGSSVTSGVGSSSSVGGSGVSGGIGSGSGTGRRDPRTGRRVGGNTNSSSVTPNSARGQTKNQPTSSSQANVSNPAHTAHAHSANGPPLAAGNTFAEIEANVRRMAVGMRQITMPPPDFDTIRQFLEQTPDAFTDTPTGKAMASSLPAASGSGTDKSTTSPNGGARANGTDAGADPRSAGKKRSSDEMATGATPQHTPLGGMQTDVFRARQAAKQSRMK